jgi:hypothetical protein
MKEAGRERGQLGEKEDSWERKRTAGRERG